MVRVCPFANLLIGPWLEFEPSATEQFWPNAERFTDSGWWPFLQGNLLFTGHLSCIGGDFFSRISVGSQTSFFGRWLCQFLKSFGVQVWFTSCTIGFFLFGHHHTLSTLQPGIVIFPGSQTSRKLGVNSVAHQPTDPGSIAIVGLHRTVYEWGTSYCVVLPRSSLVFHSTCWQFLRHNSGRFLAQLQLRRGISLPMLGLFAGTISPFSFTLDSIVDKLSTFTVLFAAVTIRYDKWPHRSPACSRWRAYASRTSSWQMEQTLDRTTSGVRTRALDLEEIHLQITALRCHGCCQFFAQWSFYLQLGWFESGRNFCHQRLPWRELIMPHLGQHLTASAVRTIVWDKKWAP